jgi:predicted PP-loop superfamily ATPase
MKDMRDGLQLIQDGFSYNNKEDILIGIAKIQKANEIFSDEKSSAKYLPEKKQRLAKVSFLSAHNLNTSLEQMKEYVKINKIIDASDSISGVVHSCTRCHAIVRGW